jgi:hypothetical protein
VGAVQWTRAEKVMLPSRSDPWIRANREKG